MKLDATAVTVQRDTVDQYLLRGPHFFWALITVSERYGLLQIASDFGDWSYRWGDTGRSSFKKFLTEIDRWYFVNKLTGGAHDYLAEETQREVFREIARWRREHSTRLSKERARELWDMAEEARAAGVFHDERAVCDELYRNDYSPVFIEPESVSAVIQKAQPRLCRRFFDEAWAPVFIPLLKAEFAAAATATEVAA